MMILEIEAMLCFAFPSRIQETQCGVETPVVHICLEQRSLPGCLCVTDTSLSTFCSQGEEGLLKGIHHSY